MEKIIKEVQAFRAAHGLKPLTNPAKIGKAKLEAQLAKFQAQALEKEKERAEFFAAQVKAAPAPEAPKPAEDIEVAPKIKAKTIKEISCELLCEVETLSDEGRTIGLSYDTVLARVLEQRPGAKTSLNCLRWYAGKIRVLADGYFQYKLPQLRMRPVSGKQTNGEPAIIVTDDA